MARAKGPPFDWDNASIAHIARHRGGRLPLGSEEERVEERHTELGETAAGRLLLVVWTYRKWRALWRRVEGGRDA